MPRWERDTSKFAKNPVRQMADQAFVVHDKYANLIRVVPSHGSFKKCYWTLCEAVCSKLLTFFLSAQRFVDYWTGERYLGGVRSLAGQRLLQLCAL